MLKSILGKIGALGTVIVLVVVATVIWMLTSTFCGFAFGILIGAQNPTHVADSILQFGVGFIWIVGAILFIVVAKNK